MSILSKIPQLIFGEQGVLLSILVNPAGTPQPVNLTGANSIILAVQYPNLINVTQLAMISSVDGNYATRIILDTDFPVEGDYMLELVVGFANGDIFKSLPITLAVGGFY
jgi:hypothetical protein